MIKVGLIILPFVAYSLDYDADHTLSCRNVPTSELKENLQYLWNKLILHVIDRYLFLVFCPLIFIGQLILIITYRKFESLRIRPGNIFYSILIIETILNLRLLATAIYATIENQDQPMPSSFQYFCSIIAVISVLFIFLHFFYLILFLCYVILLFRFSLRKKSSAFWRILHVLIAFFSVLFTFVLWMEDFMGLGYQGICGLSLARKPHWNIVMPVFILIVAIIFSFIGGFTYFYFRKHMPNSESFQRRKYNESQIIGMYVVGFSLYTTLIGVLTLIIDINCLNSSPLPGITIFVTIMNGLKLAEFVFLLYLIIKNNYFRYKLKRFLRGIFQQQRTKTLSDLSSHKVEFMEMQQLAFDEQLLGIKEQSHQIDLLHISQIYTIITGVSIAFIQYFQSTNDLNVRPIYFLEKTIFRIDNSSVIKYDTEARLLSKVKILQCNMILHAPRIFRNLLAMDGLGSVQKSFRLFQNTKKMYNLIEGKGGKSGEFFFFSADNRYVLKTITLDQFQFLEQNLQVFYEYYIQNPMSLLAKIYGLFTIKGDEMQRTYRLIMMKNILGCSRSQVLRTYDLKGSKYDRQVIKQNHTDENIAKMTLKDTDFMNLEGKINISQELGKQLRQSLRKDTLFLKSLNLIDYSLLVVRVNWEKSPQYQDFWCKLQRIKSEENKNEYYHIGIIDYMQKWDLQKKGQKWWKNFIGKKEVSAEEPNRYQNRFMQLVDEIAFNPNKSDFQKESIQSNFEQSINQTENAS